MPGGTLICDKLGSVSTVGKLRYSLLEKYALLIFLVRGHTSVLFVRILRLGSNAEGNAYDLA